MILTIILVLVPLSFLVLIHEFGHFLAAKRFGLLVEEFGLGLPPRLWGKKIGETIYSINALPVGGFVKILGEDGDETRFWQGPSERRFRSLAIWKRIVILMCGVLMNFIFGWIVISVIFMVGSPQMIQVREVQTNSPASRVGIKPNDSIVSVETDSKTINTVDMNADDFSQFIASHANQMITLEIVRGKERVSINVVPRANPVPGEGSLGVLIEAGVPRAGIFNGLWVGLKASYDIIIAIFKALGRLIAGVFTGKYSVWNDIAGPVGIYKVTKEVGSLGFVYLFHLLALISLNLAAINSLPIPALDGGRVLFLIIEKIKGSPLSPDLEAKAIRIGMAFLIALFVVVTIKDIVHF